MESAVGEFAAIKPVISGNDEPAILPWAMAIWNQSGVIKLVDAGQGANCYGFTPCNFRAANSSISRLLA